MAAVLVELERHGGYLRSGERQTSYDDPVPDPLDGSVHQGHAVLSETTATTPTQRDGHLQIITEHGRMAWQKASRYNRRARAEAAISRYKRVIGAALRSRTDQRRATEVAIAVEVLNRMLALGHPNYVRIA